jgi:Sortase and related acyltransferases
MTAPALPFTIRPYAPADAGEMGRVYFEAARALGARRYSAEQVAAWAPEPTPTEAVCARAEDGRRTWVAEGADGSLLGYCDLEADGHVDHLYCRPQAAGTGVASALLDDLLAHARAAGMRRLYVEASELARGLFARKGFALVARRDFAVRGVAIAMELRL